MRLPTMVDLMLEQMHQKSIPPLDLYALVPVHPHLHIEIRRRQHVAMIDQALVD